MSKRKHLMLHGVRLLGLLICVIGMALALVESQEQKSASADASKPTAAPLAAPAVEELEIRDVYDRRGVGPQTVETPPLDDR